MFDKYENKITTTCKCGVEVDVPLKDSIMQALNGCPDCGSRVTFTLPNVRPSDKKVN